MYSISDSMDTEVFIDCLNRAKDARGRAVMADTYLSFMTTDLRYTSTQIQRGIAYIAVLTVNGKRW